MIDLRQILAPRKDGETLVVPRLDEMCNLAHRNREQWRQADVAVLDVPLSEAQAWTRARVGVPVGSPLVALGHQPEWLHAGIWAKHVVAQSVAQRLSSNRPVNLIVDTDTEKSAALRIPRRVDGRWTVARMPVAGGPPGLRFEQLPRASAATLEATRLAVAQYTVDAGVESFVDRFFHAAGSVTSGDWVDQFIAGRRAIDHAFGINLVECRVGRAPLAPLIAWIVGDAERFVAAHNAALKAYRQANGLRGTSRPMPDLRIESHRIELPFWGALPDGPRVRPFLVRRGQEVDIETEEGEAVARSVRVPRRIESAEDFTSSLAPWRFAPRALTLTLWARLFLSDLFIHGVGGARYDAITDDLIRRWVGIEPPEYACVSATLRLDWDFGLSRGVEPAPGGSWFRFARFHPERYVDANGASAGLLSDRSGAIRESRHLRRDAAGDRLARRACFERIRALTSAVHDANPGVLAAATRRDQAEADSRSTMAAALDREYFVGLHSPQRLKDLSSTLLA